MSDTQLPSVPKGLTVTAVSSTEIILSWNKVSEAESYKVYRAKALTGEFIGDAAECEETSFRDTGLLVYTTYYYRVSSVNEEGESAWSDSVSIMMLPRNLKWFDISNEKFRHVLVASGTSSLYNGHPTTVMLDDNKTIFCVWSRDHGGSAEFLAKSENAGLTWQYLPVPDFWSITRNCPSIYKLKDQLGKERLMVFTAEPRMSQTYSEDYGETWSSVVSLNKPCVMAFTSIIQLKNGNYFGLYSRRRNNDDDPPGSPMSVWGSISTNGGITWSDSFFVADKYDKNPGEPCLIRSPDGEELAVLMRENSRTGSSLVMYSNDEAITWSEMHETIPFLTGDRHVAKYSSDGRLVVAFRDMMLDSPYYGHFVLWIGHYNDIRNNHGRGGSFDGQYRLKLLHSYAGWDTGYPGLEILPDNTVIATTYIKYEEGINKHSIVSIRLNLNELESMDGLEINFP
jgi:hypothetical protein